MKSRFEIRFDDKEIELKKNLSGIFELLTVVCGGSSTTTIRRADWSEIKSVYVFKAEAYIVDVICMEFFLENDESFEVNEHIRGWESLIENLTTYLPGCKSFSEWFTKVAFPAFEKNLMQIY